MRTVVVIFGALALCTWATLIGLAVRAFWRGQPAPPDETSSETETIESAARRVC